MKRGKRRVVKFCSNECRKEHDEIKKIRKKLNAESIFWPQQKPPIPKELITQKKEKMVFLTNTRLEKRDK